MIEVMCFHFVNREEGESAGWTADIMQLLFPGQKKGWPCRFTSSELGCLGVKNHKGLLCLEGR